MKKNLFGFGLAAILSAGLLVGCGGADDSTDEGADNGQASEESVTLTMGTSADYPPFEYIDTASGDEIIGFDIDIADHIAAELGFEYTIEDMEFNGLVEAVRTNRVDFVIAGMTPDDDRRENVDFSDIYYEGQQMIVTLNDSGFESIEDLDGKKVGVQLGSIQEAEAESIEGAIVEQRDTIPQLIQELRNGQIDAVVLEDTVANRYFERQDVLTGFMMPVSEEAGYAIAFPKESELTEQFNEVIAEMKEDGTLDELILKWFGADEE
ncbi:transporter substrate-binding domain-containing protein [Desertibacillus haloalkaliphilus]|uniref:transporter substrate-binding domain-containing protein n=1 Tax=Desertibacillus haloalkaliphilus TaxID=1328930 RepID=UPI001C27722D|nr:transporter substrate-binding domain-containing protein [Desertibacillus haloalkaliphilus]MBU8907766.1 transporter substrate-binding domain-containing protein [Desertibacillus haloalkaliphilus]